MKQVLFAAIGTFCLVAQVQAQTPFKVYTSPELPRRETLERMNLTLAWNARVAVDGNRDGIYSMQLIPGTPNQIVAQTYKGAVYLYDADNGDLIWKTVVGVPYWISQPAGFNSQSIFVTRRNTLHVLNRFTGTQRVFSYEPIGKVLMYGFELVFTPSARLIADEEFLYISSGSRISAYAIPDFETYEKIKRARAGVKRPGATVEEIELAKEKPRNVEELPAADSSDSLQPLFYWSFVIPQQNIDAPPLMSGDQISVLTPNGLLTSINRYGQGPRTENYEFKFNGHTLGSAAQHGRITYVGSEDFTLYAVDMAGGKLLWRHLSGAPIAREPHVNDREVFVSPSGVGLRSLDRANGRVNWTNRETQWFLATNNQYVYARDKVGQFFVLDNRRGGTLAKTDFSKWTISIANEWTDRVFLAANDGQIICLRHRDLVKPMTLKTSEALAKPKEEKKKDDVEKKDDAEKKEEKKDDVEKKDAARVGQLSLLMRSRGMASACLHSARRNELGLTASDDRRPWVSR